MNCSDSIALLFHESSLCDVDDPWWLAYYSRPDGENLCCDDDYHPAGWSDSDDDERSRTAGPLCGELMHPSILAHTGGV